MTCNKKYFKITLELFFFLKKKISEVEASM